MKTEGQSVNMQFLDNYRNSQSRKKTTGPKLELQELGGSPGLMGRLMKEARQGGAAGLGAIWRWAARSLALQTNRDVVNSNAFLTRA